MQLDTVPTFESSLIKWVKVIRRRSAFVCCNTRLAVSNFTKRGTSACFFDQRPIKPSAFVFLAIGVVVAVLRSPNLIAR